MKIWLSVVLCLLTALPLTGCVKGKTMFHARNSCLTYSMGGGDDGPDLDCVDRNEVCDAFLYGEAMEPLSRAECLEHCARTEREQIGRHLVDGCRLLIYEGRSQCESYCYSKPDDKAAK
ncbi:hypothetical protein [Desulfocurvus sp. DL9XJH121]